MKPVGIGLIGCGGRVRGLAQMMAKQSQDIRFVAFADPDPRSLEASKAAALAALEQLRESLV